MTDQAEKLDDNAAEPTWSETINNRMRNTSTGDAAKRFTDKLAALYADRRESKDDV